MSTLLDRVENLEKEFSGLTEWEARYKKIIELGKSIPDLPDDLRTEDAKVRGCQSQVWLHAKMENGKIQYQGDSDALLVKGLVALLLKVYSGSTPKEVLSLKPDFLKRLGFESGLTPSRANGLYAMVKQIQNFAVAFSYL